MSQSKHWENVYQNKSAESVSWYQVEATQSLNLIQQLAPGKHSSIIDVGAGGSTLVDGLIEAGFENISCLDISIKGLQVSQTRLGKRAKNVNWITSDIMSFNPGLPISIWHDRAMFHFLIDPQEREQYVNIATANVESNGVLILATFAPDGPDKCSALQIQKYDEAKIAEVFKDGFELEAVYREQHQTPWKTLQSFFYFVLRRQ